MSTNQYTNLSQPGMQPVRPGPVVVAASGPISSDPTERHRVSIYKLGVSELFLGGGCCVLWFISIIIAIFAPPHCPHYGSDLCYPIDFSATYASAGLWCGIFPMITGVLGICMRNKSTSCMYDANMAMSIISSVMMGVLIIISGVAAAMYEAYLFPLIRIPHVLLAILALAIMIVCIVHSALCCAGSCCQRKNQDGATYMAPTQQFVQLPNGQLMLVQGQPTLQQNYPVMMNQPNPVLTGQTAPMLPPATTAYPSAAMHVTAIPSQPAPAQAPMPQPASAGTQQEGVPQSYASNPPGYNA